MSLTLKPKAAADMAAASYAMKNKTTLSNEFELPLSIQEDFRLNFKNVIQGRTGIPFFRKTSGFALTAKGNSPRFKGHHILAFRGTIFEFKPDVITDFYIAHTISPYKKIIHSGFDRAFNSMKGEIADYIRTERPDCVHIIGHSLGGALANLAAVMISHEFGIPVKLYTFGAPRVGLLDFAKDLNSNGAIDHYRITHSHDPVTIVPVWPFVHAGNALQIAGSETQLLSVEAHGITVATGNPGYTASSGAHKSFFDMQVKINRLSDRERIILFYEQRNQVTYSRAWERKIRLCLQTLLHDAGFAGFLAIQNGISGIATVYDLMAHFLEKIANTADQYAERVKGLLGHILAFVGQAGRKIKKLSYAFINEVFRLMVKKLVRMAQDAINRHF